MGAVLLIILLAVYRPFTVSPRQDQRFPSDQRITGQQVNDQASGCIGAVVRTQQECNDLNCPRNYKCESVARSCGPPVIFGGPEPEECLEVCGCVPTNECKHVADCSQGVCPNGESCRSTNVYGGGCDCKPIAEDAHISVTPVKNPRQVSKADTFNCKCVDPRIIPLEGSLGKSLWPSSQNVFIPLRENWQNYPNPPPSEMPIFTLQNAYDFVCTTEGDPSKCKTKREVKASVRLFNPVTSQTVTWHLDNEWPASPHFSLSGAYGFLGNNWAKDDAETQSQLPGAHVTLKTRDQIIAAGHPEPEHVRAILSDATKKYLIFLDGPHFDVAYSAIPSDSTGFVISRQFRNTVIFDPPTKKLVCVFNLVQSVRMVAAPPPNPQGAYLLTIPSQVLQRVSCGEERN